MSGAPISTGAKHSSPRGCGCLWSSGFRLWSLVWEGLGPIGMRGQMRILSTYRNTPCCGPTEKRDHTTRCQQFRDSTRLLGGKPSREADRMSKVRIALALKMAHALGLHARFQLKSPQPCARRNPKPEPPSKITGTIPPEARNIQSTQRSGIPQIRTLRWKNGARVFPAPQNQIIKPKLLNPKP